MAVMHCFGLMPSDKPRITLYVDADIKADVEKLAAQQDRTISNFVVQLIKREIAAAKANGLLPRKAETEEDI